MIDAPAAMHRNDSAAISSAVLGTLGLAALEVAPLMAASMMTGSGITRSLFARRGSDEPGPPRGAGTWNFILYTKSLDSRLRLVAGQNPDSRSEPMRRRTDVGFRDRAG